jgi:two-component system chemotaxis response regulator CheB
MIRVLVVDDSAVVRRVLSLELNRHRAIEVVGTAVDPYAAREAIARLKPDVLTLDVNMPRMDGITFLEKLMHFHPLPVVVVSSLTPRNSGLAIRALALGAVEVICKDGSALSDREHGLNAAVLRAAQARIGGDGPLVGPPAAVQVSERSNAGIIAIGASTGGPRAVEAVLKQMPGDSPPIIIVQHMPASFTGPFAARLDSICAICVREAVAGVPLLPGNAWIAPGGSHLTVKDSGTGLLMQLSDAPPRNYHRPSVDVLFESLAETAGVGVIAALLTGMGDDGARGLLALHRAGAYTIAQDESSSVVFGMPRAAIEMGAAEKVVALPRIGHAILTAKLASAVSGR